VLGCKESDIQDIQVIKKGLTNLSFSFECKGERYVYRHPGPGTSKRIDRHAEAVAEEVATRLGIDTTLVHIDPEAGWKLSRHLYQARDLDYSDIPACRQAVRILRKLHDAAAQSPNDWDIWGRVQRMLDSIPAEYLDIPFFPELLAQMTRLHDHLAKEPAPKVLCHCDTYAPNFLIEPDGSMTLIDWEYASNDDPIDDIACFVVSAKDWTHDDVMDMFRTYYGRELTPQEFRHAMAFTAINGFHWFVWALEHEARGVHIGEYQLIWYEYGVKYLRIALPLYEEQTDAGVPGI